MDATYIAAAGLVGIAVLFAVARRRGSSGAASPEPRHDDSDLHGRRAAAEAEVEESDIDAMLDAINERRRRRGAREVGEELSDELRRGTWDDE